MANPAFPDPTTLDAFKGLNNVLDPMRAGWEWQELADNVEGTDDGNLVLRDGYTSFLSGTAIAGAYSTTDLTRLYIIDSGELKRVMSGGTTVTLATGITGTPYWSEINTTVYLSCGTSKLMIEQDNTVREWGVPTPTQPNILATTGSLFAGVVQVCLAYMDSYGREGGASIPVAVTVGDAGGVIVSDIPLLSGYTAQLYATEPDGTVFYRVTAVSTTGFTFVTAPYGPELLTANMYAPPAAGQLVAFFGGRAHLSEYMPSADQSVVCRSLPLGFHLFRLDRDYFMVPGEIVGLCGSDSQLLILTRDAVFTYNGEALVQEADYGAVPGQKVAQGADGKLYFWTVRGLCSVSPFANLTEARVSVAPGVSAGGGIVDMNGYKKYVAVIKSGGGAYNAR